ncbi:hypothetical protein VTN02DRAFT_5862 [Thermoascus thermophilus]
MSHPSPKKRSSGSDIPQPRQIRFVSTDGQPQAKRRRVTAACRTCRRRKIRCSGEQPVCKTCSNYGHTCLGYNEPPQLQSQAKTHSRNAATAASPARTVNADSHAPRAVQSHSPETPRITLPSSVPEKSPSAANVSESKVVALTKDTLSQANKEREPAAVESPESGRTSLGSSHRTHVPYFRYFGPTAIVPGFKQMVVRVRDPRKCNLSLSSGSSSSPFRSPKFPDLEGTSLAAALGDMRDSNTIPFYEKDDNLPTSNLVTHLCELFFVHLGCNFPFLRRDRFLRDLKEKRIDTILVDAVCALAARFSPHPLLRPPQARPIDGNEAQKEIKKSDYGQPFAHRAMTALVDALSCPTLSVVQACLLLAYEEFGSNHDSGLWMYLGISIRMAQDLGMQKLQGLKYSYGRTGLTPKAIKTGQAGTLSEGQYDSPRQPENRDEDTEVTADERARERERVDSFWSIFFLDRVISSGTGRPVTLRDEEIELHFPLQSESQLPNGWPAPFPPLIRIIHLYGRVTDLLNAIQEVNHITPETLKRLAGMESDLTGIYQRLSPKLHFNAVNFQTYVKAQEGTNFILLHFWFHTLIVLLHQPTLLNSFGGRIQQLYPNSRELSMSSAKTIADILSFSELIDAKSFIGNPFTSQPIYIAACAFLMESAYYSSPSSQDGSPPAQPLSANQSSGFMIPNMESSNGSERKPNAKHILLASAAKENYQRCYKALKSLEAYWEGAKYIITVLDQKAKGICDPLLYTAEEMDSAVELPPVQPFAPSSWRRARTRPGSVEPSKKQSDGPTTLKQEGEAQSDVGASPKIDPSQAIGWALTGATNSSQPNLSLLYHMPVAQTSSVPTQAHYPSQYSHTYPSSVQTNVSQTSNASYSQMLASYPSADPARNSSVGTRVEKYPPMSSEGVSSSDASLLLGLNTPYTHSGSRASSGTPTPYEHNMASSPFGNLTSAYNYHMPTATAGHGSASQIPSSHANPNPGVSTQVGGMMIESQDIDMNTLQNQDAFPFSFNGELLPWLEYLPQDVLSYFGEHQNYTPLMSPDGGTNPAPRPRPP